MVDIPAIEKAGRRGALVREYQARLASIRSDADMQFLADADIVLQSIESNLADARQLAAAWKEICHD